MVIYNKEGDKLVCMFPKRLDTATCTSSQDEIMRKVGEEKLPIVFDMKEVNYVASSFLRICLQVFKHAGQGNFKLINVSPEVKKVFKISGFENQMKIE